MSAQSNARKQVKKAKRKASALVERLPSLDLSNLEAVLDWICAFQDSVSCIRVAKRHQQQVLETFIKHGFQPNINTGKAYNSKDKDNVARYIIGQALKDLRDDGFILQVVHRFTNDWKTEFAD